MTDISVVRRFSDCGVVFAIFSYSSISLACCVGYCRKLNMNHELVKELAGKDRRALCIVTAVVKTAAPASINSTLNIDVSGDEDVCIYM